MCTYTSHIHTCPRCAAEDTVLISEQLCLPAKSSGIFGSCEEGALYLRDTTEQDCWECKDQELVTHTGIGTALGIGMGVGVGERRRMRWKSVSDKNQRGVANRARGLTA